MSWRRQVRFAGLALLACAAGITHAGASEARDWIQRMNKAVVERNYDGVFAHHFGERREVMRIVHRFKDGEMIERVIATDGSGYEQKRKGSSWAQFFPDKRRVETATRNRSFGYIPTLNGLDDQSARHYNISDAGPARLIGRDVQLIRVEPKDNLRYGYHFWLDQRSALPLKFQRISQDGKVLKEIAFVSPPGLPEEISDDQLKVAVDFKEFRWVDRDLRAPMRNPELKRDYAPRAALLPAGYRSRVFGTPAQEADANARGPRSRFIVSDGVSWVEVFVAPAAGEARPAGGSTMGPVSSYQLRLDDVQVIVVGEVPLAAAQAIAQAVRPE